MRCLVTGAGGFAGGHLVTALLAREHEVWASGLDPLGDLTPAGTHDAPLDVTDRAACNALVRECRPDWVFHLAGFAHVGKAEQEPEECLAVNFGGTRNLLEACLEASPDSRFLLVSSAEVYGRVAPGAPPLPETAPMRPATVYAVSKAASELAGYHAHARGLDVVILRPFNHIGPGQSADFVSSAFARQVAAIEAGLQEPVLRVGNLGAVRDFCDVRDAMATYVMLAARGGSGEIYNVTSGVGVSIREVLTTLISLSRVEVRVETDPERLRTLDIPALHGSGEKLVRLMGRHLELDLERTLGDVLDYWRATIGAERAR